MHIGKEISRIDIKILLLLATTLFCSVPLMMTLSQFDILVIVEYVRGWNKKEKIYSEKKSNHSDKIIDATRHILNITVFIVALYIKYSGG